MNGNTLLIFYRWPDGREELRYERPADSEDARKLLVELEEAWARCELLGEECPYFVTFK